MSGDLKKQKQQFEYIFMQTLTLIIQAAATGQNKKEPPPTTLYITYNPA